MILEGRVLNNKYKVIEKVAEGGMSTVWLAEDMVGKGKVAVKVLKKNAISNRIEDIIRFKNEAFTVSKMNIEGTGKIYEIGEIENTHYIIMEYFYGNNLHNLLVQGTKLSTSTVIEIMIKICESLKLIHDKNIIHRDLKPGNIIVGFKEKERFEGIEVKIIDFGLAQIKEFNLKDKEEIVGTLSYMSPEQSGAMKRTVDERSDLYSLGIIFYQLLTNKLPFKADNINSIIHQHIAKIPEKTTSFDSRIPVILDSIVFKLLEKEPENRYQSASGLLNDLQKFKDGFTEFEIGIEDKIIKLNYRTKLIGRELELKILSDQLDKVSEGSGCICVISGEAGSGKTRLAEELRSNVLEKKGLYLDAKCFSGKNKIPYGAFRDALSVYIKEFAKYPEEKKNEIIKLIKDEFGNLGEVLISLNPMMKEIIGPCPPLIELDPERENKRFLLTICRFLYHLAKIDCPLIFMLDDLQWSDEGTIELLSELGSGIKAYPLMIIGTYRDDGTPDVCSLSQFINNSKLNNNPFIQIKLSAFDDQSMNEFISNLLYDHTDNIKYISRFILQRSKGNTLFAKEILKQLVDEKAIIWKSGRWHIENTILEKIEISSTIVDTLIKRISQLNDQEINILSYAAVIGRTFDIELLFSLVDLSMEKIVEIVDKAIALQLLEESLLEHGKLHFTHDRLKEAFCKNISQEKLKALHMEIGRTIERMNASDKDHVVFDLAYHYIEADEKNKILEYAFPAGKKAKANYSNEEAIRYLQLVKNILEKRYEKGSDLWVESVKCIGEIYVTIGRNNEAISLFNNILPYMKSKLDKAYAYKQISYAYSNKNEWVNSEEYARLGLRILGEKLPVKRWDVIKSIAWEIILQILHSFFPKVFICGNKKVISEEDRQIIGLYYMLTWSYTLRDVHKILNSILRMVNLSESRMGKSRELISGYNCYSYLLIGVPWMSLAKKTLEKCLIIGKELDDEWSAGQAYYAWGIYYTCKGEYRKCIENGNESIRIYKKLGDIKELGIAMINQADGYYHLSDYQNARMLSEQYYEICCKNNDIFGKTASWINTAKCCLQMGDLEDAESYSLKAVKLADDNNIYFNYFMAISLLGKVYLEKGERDKAFEFLYKARDIDKHNRFLKEFSVQVYPDIADYYIDYYFNNGESLTKCQKKRVLKKIKMACKEALKETKRWVSHFSGALRVMAIYMSLIGENKKAEVYFLESIKLCKKIEMKFEMAKGLYEYGKHLKRLGKILESKSEFENAYHIFKEINAKKYENRVANMLGIINEGDSTIDRFTRELKNNQRMTSILELTQDISSTLDLNILLEKLVSIALQVTGAQRGFLLVMDEDDLNVNVLSKKNMSVTPGEDAYSKNIIDVVLKSGKAVFTTNAMEDTRFSSFQSVIYHQLKSVLCVPIKYKGEVNAVCYLDNPLSSSVFTEDDMEVLNTIMTQAAISIENAKLYREAVTDGLTEINVHKHFLSLLQKEIDRAERYNHSVALIIFDVDHFKVFNDSFGHQAGDAVLKNIAEVAKESVRDIDILGRYGGEEFGVILPETDMTEAIIAAERLHEAIGKAEVLYKGSRLKVTVSLGVACFPGSASEIGSLIKAADDAMYTSKEKGRNRVSSAK